MLGLTMAPAAPEQSVEQPRSRGRFAENRESCDCTFMLLFCGVSSGRKNCAPTESPSKPAVSRSFRIFSPRPCATRSSGPPPNPAGDQIQLRLNNQKGQPAFMRKPNTAVSPARADGESRSRDSMADAALQLLAIKVVFDQFFADTAQLVALARRGGAPMLTLCWQARSGPNGSNRCAAQIGDLAW